MASDVPLGTPSGSAADGPSLKDGSQGTFPHYRAGEPARTGLVRLLVEDVPIEIDA